MYFVRNPNARTPNRHWNVFGVTPETTRHKRVLSIFGFQISLLGIRNF
jgi:hypothetical protein